MGISNATTIGCGIGLTLINRALLSAGLRKPRDGWRRGAGLVLSKESATFVLSAFSVNFLSDSNGENSSPQSHFEKRLAAFLAGEKDCHARIRCDANEHVREALHVPCYTLSFTDWIDGPARFLSPDFGPNESSEALLNFVVRLHPARGADVWMRVNHVGADGVPMQEVLSRLESNCR